MPFAWYVIDPKAPFVPICVSLPLVKVRPSVPIPPVVESVCHTNETATVLTAAASGCSTPFGSKAPLVCENECLCHAVADRRSELRLAQLAFGEGGEGGVAGGVGNHARRC